MRLLKSFLLSGLALVSLGSALDVYAREGKEDTPPAHWLRCHEQDQLSNEQAKGRIAWAKKCSFFDGEDVEYHLKKERYPSFIHNNGNFNAPTDPKDSCDGWKKGYIICEWGCYTPEQRVLFSGGYLPIGEAQSTETHVSAMTLASTLKNPHFADQEIEAFISGRTKETVLNLRTETGKSLRVTQNHPLVLGSGAVVKASQLRLEDSLIGLVDESDLSLVQAEKLMSIQSEIYEGVVHNLEPVSTHKLNNIHVAEGLLNGSNRFQNEWSQKEFRIRMRVNHDLGDL